MGFRNLRFRVMAFIVVGIFISLNVKGQGCNCDFTIPAGSGTYNFDGVSKNAHGGQVICLQSGQRTAIQFTNLVGSPNNPITIINCGGQVILGGSTAQNALLFLKSRYVHVTGTGESAINYGIKVTSTQTGSMGVGVVGLSSDFEIDHMEIQNAGYAGLMIKTDPNCTDNTPERPNFTMYNISVHDNYVHESGAEGLYLGNSFYTGTTVYCGYTQYPHEVHGVRVFNNRFENTGQESIQVGCGVEDIEIHDNQIYNSGRANNSSQNGGIQVGVGTTGRVYNNFIKGGPGPSIVVEGIGENYIYNNMVVNSGYAAVVINTRPTPLSTDIVPNGFLGGVYVINNTFINPTQFAIVEYINQAKNNVFYNNLIVMPQSTWQQMRTDTDWKFSNNIVLKSITDAKFADPAQDDYRLLPGSPAIDAGRDVSSYKILSDYDGSVRPVNSVWDVGAFELNAQTPVVSAGLDQTITIPTNSVVLKGTASDADGIITKYQWTKQSGPAVTLSNAASPTLTATGMVEGSYVFRLTVTDDKGATAYDEVKVTVLPEKVNQPPVANAGADKVIQLPINTVTISGSGSDADGTITKYQWTLVSGPAATLQNATTATLTAINLLEGSYIFGLTVTDSDGATGYDEVKVTVQAANVPPTANAGPDKTIQLPTNSVVLNGSGSDTDGNITKYQWTKQSGPSATLTNATTATLTAQNLLEGIYLFRLTVTDNNGATGYDEVQATVQAVNQAPKANAGSDIAIKLPINSTNLQGSGSDADGTVVSYLWEKVSGPAATLGDVTKPVMGISGLVAGTYTFGLTVTDDKGATGYDEVVVTVQAANIAPTANAGSDIILNLPTNSTNIVGTGTDIDGTVTTYQWTKKTGPSLTITNANKPTVTLSNLVEGTYVMTLTVTDNEGAKGTDDVTITVLAANQPPTANAGADKIIQLPSNNVIVNGSGSDNDGTISSYAWLQVSGPSATLSGLDQPTLTVTSMVEGIYIFGLTVTDNDGATDYDEVKVTVTAANIPPTVNAGPDKDITLPTNSVVLTSTASDQDGSIAAYQWTKVSGSSATLTNTTTYQMTASGLVQGNYTFRVTVTDNEGATAYDDVVVHVLAANQSPTADAGPDQTITLPTNSLVLNGSGTDNDGSIVSYLWAKVSGPNATLVNGTTATLTLQNLVEGTYIFGLTVTDNDGATGYDEVIVQVNPQPPVNQAPVANAGSDQSITLPQNSITINGSGTDTDGTIVSYSWIKVSGPAVTMANADKASLDLSNLIEGTYVLRLTVTDDQDAAGSDEMQLTVYPQAVNQSPVVNAGSDKSITLPQNSAAINATASDADGTITAINWQTVSGPNSPTLSGQNTLSLTASNLLQGTYTFSIMVTDNDGATASDQVKVIVNAANQAPTVNAGPDKTIQLPTNALSITAAANDNDGTIASYLWTKVSGPAGAALNNTSTATVDISGLVEGTYVFQITVTDDDNATGSDQVKVIVQSANQPPVANAGADKQITLPTNTINIYGSASDPDGSIAMVEWTKENGPSVTLVNQQTLTLTANDLQEGTYTFRLTVTDDKGATAFDDVKVTVVSPVINQAPVANAGPDKSITLPTNSFTINGSGTDQDGSVVSYSWTKVSGPAVTIQNANSSSVTLTNLVQGDYHFQLTVTDDKGATGSDEMVLSVSPAVNISPVANAGPDITVTLPVAFVNIDGSGSDPDGTIATYLWVKVSGPAATLTNSNKPTVSISNLLAGTYVFRLTVTDDKGATATDDMKLTVNDQPVNQPPAANAGPDISITLPTNSVNISGKGTDIDGSISSYHWQKISGSTATLQNTNSAVLSVSGLIEGTYTFRLTVTDNDGATASDDVKVTVNPAAINNPPIANAGKDIILTLPLNSTNVNGSGSDNDGTVVSYQWQKISGPAATISNSDKNVLILSNLVEGVYIFRLTVTDDQGATATDDVKITVNPATVNQPPVANAGSDITVQLPTNTVNINGSGSDADGTISAYAWIKVSGPTVNLTNTSTATLTVSNLIEGKYVFRLTVTDDKGAKASDDVQVIVNPENINQNPTVDAGPDRNVFLPTNSISLTANASDPDGTVVTYEWVKISGPNATLSDPTKAVISITDMVEGTYIFEVTVTDNQGASDNDQVRVYVKPEIINQPPIADAGPDITVNLPTNSVNLSGTGSDNDGNITAYQWKKISGPTVTIANSTKPTATATGLLEGQYTFRLTVTDNSGATAYDDVIVTVLPERVNKAPIAIAGQDIDLYWPTNQVTLSGAGSDEDGSIVSYHWNKISGPANDQTSADSSAIYLTNMEIGDYQYQLIVMDNNGATGTDYVTITVHPDNTNQPPRASAGDDVVKTLPLDSLVLTGYGYDPEGQQMQYSWVKVSGPAITINTADSLLVLKDIVAGVYVFRLRVEDDQGATANDNVIVTINPAGVNQSPEANAGQDVYITLPQDTVSIFGKGFDPEKQPLTYQWTLISGEDQVTMEGINSATLKLSGLLEGQYEFALTVTDDKGASSTDRVKVYVNPVLPDNQPPTADAGEDLELGYPVTGYQVIGHANDVDGLIIGYQWEMIAGPAVDGMITNTDTLTLGNLAPGEYTYRLTVYDNDSAMATDELVILNQ